MKNPGPIAHGSAEHKAMLDYAAAVAKAFGISEAPALGILLKLHAAMSKAADAERGMGALIIECKEEPEA